MTHTTFSIWLDTHETPRSDEAFSLKIATVVESGRNMKVEAEMLSAVAKQQ